MPIALDILYAGEISQPGDRADRVKSTCGATLLLRLKIEPPSAWLSVTSGSVLVFARRIDHHVGCNIRVRLKREAQLRASNLERLLSEMALVSKMTRCGIVEALRIASGTPPNQSTSPPICNFPHLPCGLCVILLIEHLVNFAGDCAHPGSSSVLIKTRSQASAHLLPSQARRCPRPGNGAVEQRGAQNHRDCKERTTHRLLR